MTGALAAGSEKCTPHCQDLNLVGNYEFDQCLVRKRYFVQNASDKVLKAKYSYIRNQIQSSPVATGMKMVTGSNPTRR